MGGGIEESFYKSCNDDLSGGSESNRVTSESDVSINLTFKFAWRRILPDLTGVLGQGFSVSLKFYLIVFVERSRGSLMQKKLALTNTQNAFFKYQHLKNITFERKSRLG